MYVCALHLSIGRHLEVPVPCVSNCKYTDMQRTRRSRARSFVQSVLGCELVILLLGKCLLPSARLRPLVRTHVGCPTRKCATPMPDRTAAPSSPSSGCGAPSPQLRLEFRRQGPLSLSSSLTSAGLEEKELVGGKPARQCRQREGGFRVLTAVEAARPGQGRAPMTGARRGRRRSLELATTCGRRRARRRSSRAGVGEGG